MIPQKFDYARPASLAEALTLLASGEAKAIAGGMSLIPMMKLRLAAPDRLVDLGKISELNYIRETNGGIAIGATTTHHEIENAPLLRSKCPVLAETAANIGDLQVRNRGTIGGSIAHADPAADYPAALMALEAQVRLSGPGGQRTVTAADFFIDTFATALEPGELVTEIIVPAEDTATGTTYRKVVQPASGFAVVGIAARVKKVSGRITMARIGVTGLSSKAFRAVEAEKAFESGSDASTAAALITKGIEANSDLYASAEYRLRLAGVYGARALAIAVSRAA